MLEITHVTKTFSPSTIDERKALDDISLSVDKGEFITVIGANGAGKSTLFNAICGNFMTERGLIVLDGQDITMKPQHERSKAIGRLFQDPTSGTAPNMSIEENLALACGSGKWMYRINKKDRQFFREKLGMLKMGLEDRLSQPVGTLSGGQRQAMALMMATINPPKLLLLDEHTAALDPQAAEKILEITAKIIEENSLTCLMITHNMESALQMGTRTIMMHEGRIIYDVKGEERKNLTVNDLLTRFRQVTGKNLDTDRILMN